MENKESDVIKWLKNRHLIEFLEQEEGDVLRRWESNLAELALKHKRDTELSWYGLTPNNTIPANNTEENN